MNRPPCAGDGQGNRSERKGEKQMLDFYILMWPIMSAAVLILIVYTFTKELRQAKREGRTVV